MDFWIVVVDDEPLSLTNAKSILEEEKMKVSCLSSGKQLLKFVEKNEPDLILLDVMMQDMDGFETYNALRKHEDDNGKPHIPVIFLTAEDDSDVERRGLKVGASDFIKKPFVKGVLVKRIVNTISNNRTIESLKEEANYDKLTGFLNKAGGTRRISRLCNEQTGAMMVIDLDSFKLVNDLFGHEMGDRVLEAFAEIFRRNTRQEDIISRIGGDEFLGFFSEMTNEEAVSSLCKRLNLQLGEEAEKLMGEDYGIPLGISIGVVFVPEHGRDFDSLFALADSALYSVKQNGKHGFLIYDQGEFTDRSSDDPEQDMMRLLMTVEERNEKSGALLLGRESFAIAYRFVIRFCKRYGGTDVRILFTIKPEEGYDKRQIPEVTAQFGLVLQRVLRRSDLIMQNRYDQFFVMLTERTRFEAETVIKRIMNTWEKSEYSRGVKISYFHRTTDYSGM